MSNKLGQEPAFPNDNTMDCQPPYCYGMSKRFYAACAAMQGLLVNVNRNGFYESNKSDLIKSAYECADELLKQENQ